MEVITFAKEFCDILQHDGKILPATADIQAHIDEIWMEEALEFSVEANHKLIDVDVNVATKNKNPFVVAIFKFKPNK